MDRSEDVGDAAFAAQRLEVVAAMLSAIDRRDEVFATISSSETPDSARSHLSMLLGVTEIGSLAILDMQARRFTHAEADRLRAEQAHLLRSLES